MDPGICLDLLLDIGIFVAEDTNRHIGILFHLKFQMQEELLIIEHQEIVFFAVAKIQMRFFIIEMQFFRIQDTLFIKINGRKEIGKESFIGKDFF